MNERDPVVDGWMAIYDNADAEGRRALNKMARTMALVLGVGYVGIGVWGLVWVHFFWP